MILVGAIVIYRQEVRPFTDKQIELVQNFAAQAVIAIENTRLLNELRRIAGAADGDRRRSERHQFVARRLEPVFQAMLENAMRICEAKFGTLFLFDGETLCASAAHARRAARICRIAAARARHSAEPDSRSLERVHDERKQTDPHRRSVAARAQPDAVTVGEARRRAITVSAFRCSRTMS